MEFEEFKHKIVKIKKMKLPGESAQFKMAPKERINELKKIADVKKRAKKAGVLALFYPSVSKQTMFALILRKTYKGVHSAQIGFPGGKFEAMDSSLRVTALRETEEEIGVNQNKVTVLKKLTEVYIPPSNFLVSPFVAIDDFLPSFKEDPREVKQHIEIPLHELIRLKVKQTPLDEHLYKGVTVPSYVYQEHIIWGATAMILSEFKVFLEYCALI